MEFLVQMLQRAVPIPPPHASYNFLILFKNSSILCFDGSKHQCLRVFYILFPVLAIILKIFFNVRNRLVEAPKRSQPYTYLLST